MAKAKAAAKKAKSRTTKVNPLALDWPSWISKFQYGTEPVVGKNPKATGYVYVLGEEDRSYILSLIQAHSLDWQTEKIRKSEKEVIHFIGKLGPVWMLRQKFSNEEPQHAGLLKESQYSWTRDQVGALVSAFKNLNLDQAVVEFHGTSDDQDLGALVGFELASYNFKSHSNANRFESLPVIHLRKTLTHFDRTLLKTAELRANAVNLARHFVNLPPNFLNPTTMADAVKAKKWPRTCKVEIWDMKRLQKEGMGLHVAVGQGSKNAPCMIHIKYRPSVKTKLQPVAFVGKGVTFDTGGLDIKPSSGMRLMKKDMGGAACVLALANWAAASNYEGPLDFYLGMAENSVDANSFRPSDVCVARNGLEIEIHNTDAEGRLVLADCLDVAVTATKADAPEVVIDVATLTGAIKVALGADLAGLFSNDDQLALQLSTAGQSAGDLNWRMPLFDRYNAMMSSPFADLTNAVDGFGGAITAALFLQKFVRGKKWAHLDIYAWTDKASGALSASGGSGQGVQALMEWLESRI